VAAVDHLLAEFGNTVLPDEGGNGFGLPGYGAL
jgi:hypothetical protein